MVLPVVVCPAGDVEAVLTSARKFKSIQTIVQPKQNWGLTWWIIVSHLWWRWTVKVEQNHPIILVSDSAWEVSYIMIATAMSLAVSRFRLTPGHDGWDSSWLKPHCGWAITTSLPGLLWGTYWELGIHFLHADLHSTFTTVASASSSFFRTVGGFGYEAKETYHLLIFCTTNSRPRQRTLQKHPR